MKKILILTSRYLPYPDANGINTKYIVDELKNRGYEVTCISEKGENESSFEIIDGTPIYRMAPSLYSRILYKEANLKKNKLNHVVFKIIHLLRKLYLSFMVFKFPNFDLFHAKRLYRLINSLHETEKFNCVLGVFKPFFNIAALSKFKKNNSEIRMGAYYLDLINSSPKPSFMPRKFYDWLCYKGDFNTFKGLNFVLMAKAGESIYMNSKYDGVRNKIEYIDFPTFTSTKDLKKDQSNNMKSDVVVVTYAGTLDRNYRNPTYLLKCLEAASVLIGNIELNIYGKDNCADIFDEYNKSKTLTIKRHGIKSHEYVVSAMLESDFLVNISNKLQNAVPSKIFEIFSMGKPIINLTFDKKDITTEYFQRYPSFFNIEQWEEIDNQTKELTDFIRKEKGNEYPTEQIKKNFIMNTPEYTVDIIEAHL